MTKDSSENENFTIARAITEKFEFYLLALVFTILGLAVQTAVLQREWFQYGFELSAWGLLLISGLAGLSQIEWSPVIYAHFGQIQKDKVRLDAMKQGLAGRPLITGTGDEIPLQDIQAKKSSLEEGISERRGILDELEKRNLLKYKIHKWTFVAGIISLSISRAISGLAKIF